MAIKILFLVSQTADQTDVEAQVEHHDVTKVLDSSEHGKDVSLIWASAVRVDELQPLLNKHDPAIVHFSGHGDGQGGIILRDHHGASVSLDAEQLKKLFSNFRKVVRMVVLNACYTDSQAAAIAEEVECAIGTNASIGAFAARTFSAALYGAIASGCDVAAAYEQAVTALHLTDSDDKHVTRLLPQGGVDPAKITFLPVLPADADTDTLELFLRARFTDSEFREFVQHAGGEDIDWGAYSCFLEGDLEVMAERGRIGAAFFVALENELPKHRDRIMRLRAAWKGTGSP